MTEWVYTKTNILFNLVESGRIVTSWRIFCRYSPRFQRIIVNYCEKQIGFTLLTTLLLTCFQTLHPRKRGFLHKTGFSLPHRSIQLWWFKFVRIERAKNTRKLFVCPSWDFLWSQEIKAILRGQPIYFGGGGVVDFEKRNNLQANVRKKKIPAQDPPKIVILQTLWNNLLNCQSLIVK